MELPKKLGIILGIAFLLVGIELFSPLASCSGSTDCVAILNTFANLTSAIKFSGLGLIIFGIIILVVTLLSKK